METIQPKRAGLSCHALADYCLGVQLALGGHFDRRYVRERAQRYDMCEVAKQHDYTFRCIADLRAGRAGSLRPATTDACTFCACLGGTRDGS